MQRVDDGNDLDGARRGDARRPRPRPRGRRSSRVRTTIGYGSPHKQGTAEAHGEPLGADEVAATKENLGWPLEPTFLVPDEARAGRSTPPRERGAERDAPSGTTLLAPLSRGAIPSAAAELERRLARRAARRLARTRCPPSTPGGEPIATREASGKVINGTRRRKLPELVGGSADLTPSNNTLLKGGADFSADDRAGPQPPLRRARARHGRRR